jgi:hypothetical protein
VLFFKLTIVLFLLDNDGLGFMIFIWARGEVLCCGVADILLVHLDN